jgi:DNA-binding response OmpR family regulator
MAESPTGRVMVAEYLWTERYMLVELLEADGIEVHQADNGRTALDLCRIVRPHLLVVAQQLPALSGFELLARLRADRRIGTMPVLVLLDDDSDTTAAAALDAGANDVLPKSPSCEGLIERVRRLLGEPEPVAARAAG